MKACKSYGADLLTNLRVCSVIHFYLEQPRCNTAVQKEQEILLAPAFKQVLCLLHDAWKWDKDLELLQGSHHQYSFLRQAPCHRLQLAVLCTKGIHRCAILLASACLWDPRYVSAKRWVASLRSSDAKHNAGTLCLFTELHQPFWTVHAMNRVIDRNFVWFSILNEMSGFFLSLKCPNRMVTSLC